MNCFISLRAIKPMLAATVANSGRIDANRKVFLFLTKPYANYYHFVSKPRLGGSTVAPCKQIAAVSKRAVSNNTSPAPSYKNHDHAHVWLWERFVAVGLLGVIPFLFFEPSDAVEYAAASLVAIHSHWGLEAICTDYLRPAVVGNFIPKCIFFIAFVPVLFVFYGLVNSTLTDRGFLQVFRQFWRLKTTQQLKDEQQSTVVSD